MKCHEQVKLQEAGAGRETVFRHEHEQNIHQLRNSPNPEEIFERILEKSVLQKAREKMKLDNKKDEETDQVVEKDYLAPILKKIGLQKNEKLEEEAAIQVKNEALRSLKERLLTRAEIIQRRLDEEQKKLEQAYVSSLQFQFNYDYRLAKTQETWRDFRQQRPERLREGSRSGKFQDGYPYRACQSALQELSLEVPGSRSDAHEGLQIGSPE